MAPGTYLSRERIRTVEWPQLSQAQAHGKQCGKYCFFICIGYLVVFEEFKKCLFVLVLCWFCVLSISFWLLVCGGSDIQFVAVS
jgi:hypothetical protein